MLCACADIKAEWMSSSDGGGGGGGGAKGGQKGLLPPPPLFNFQHLVTLFCVAGPQTSVKNYCSLHFTCKYSLNAN